VTDCRWVLLYVKRWLAAPLQRPDGTLQQRSRGTPQGSAISPCLANLFMHYAFDQWMVRNYPDCPFEESAGITRHGVGDENALHRRSSDPRWSRVMRWRSARAQRSVDRGRAGGAIEPRNNK